MLVDWNWGTQAPAWFDLVSVLVGPYGDGLDVEPILNENPLLNGVDPEFVDGFLALLFGYFRNAAAQPAVPTSPFLRAHQAWYRDAAWSWLAARRGWVCPPDEL